MADLAQFAAKEERQLCRAFAALSAKPRLDVVRFLVGSGAIGLTAGAIAERLGISPSNASFHLKELEHAGLIVSQRSGRSVIYVISKEGLRDIVGFLSGLRERRNTRPATDDDADNRAESPGENDAGQ
jgi:DNA-binding transcriptional ArsR family regulator